MKVLTRIFYRILDKLLEIVCLHIRPECEFCHVRKICERFERIKRCSCTLKHVEKPRSNENEEIISKEEQSNDGCSNQNDLY